MTPGYLPPHTPLDREEIERILEEVSIEEDAPNDAPDPEDFWSHITRGVRPEGYCWDRVEAAIERLAEIAKSGSPEDTRRALYEAKRQLHGAKSYTQHLEHDFTQTVRIFKPLHRKYAKLEVKARRGRYDPNADLKFILCGGNIPKA